METENKPKLPRGIAQRKHRDLDHLSSEEYQIEARRRAYQEKLRAEAAENWENAGKCHSFTLNDFFEVEIRVVQEKKGVEFSKPYHLAKIDPIGIIVIEGLETHAALEEWLKLYIHELGGEKPEKETVVKLDQTEMFPTHEG